MRVSARGWGKYLKTRIAKTAFALFVVLIGLVACDFLFPPPLARADDVSILVTDREGRPLRAFPANEGRWRYRADLARVDPVFLEALIAVEDKRFYEHWGVDGIAVIRAASSALRAGEIVSGASTITMQTARLLEPRDRTLSSKMIEMLRAFQIERRLSKTEILELYLTLAPYGGNLEGIRAASWAYFGREPDRLSDDQIALLIALPQAPEARRPDLRPKTASAARKRILDELHSRELISAQRAEEGDASPIPIRRNFPADAWHAAARARDETGFGRDQASTLDKGLQEALRQVLDSAGEDFEPDVQIAAMIVETETRAVRAAIGSVSRERAGGWIDLTNQPRSPGSTLKPFIYAMAFDDGIAFPDTLIQDLPSRFSTYRPQNFDRSFRGDVTIEDALQHSLNVPAVLALERIGPARFLSSLQMADLDVSVPEAQRRDPGLALALGGVGMTLSDLANLYAGLDDGGVIKPLIWHEADTGQSEASTGHRIISEASADRIKAILRKSPAPAGWTASSVTQDAPEIAFKTGTSYGFRDAWAAGVARGHAIVIWVGRADGAPRIGQTGRDTALPILFEAFDRLSATLSVEGDSEERLETVQMAGARSALREFTRDDAPPQILFPPENAEILLKPETDRYRGYVLAGRGDGALSWYVNGTPIEEDAGGAPLWRPEKPGFYSVSVVDDVGRETKVKVRLIEAS